MADAFKFVHASDFHLDEPIEGLAEIPSQLKAMLASAPYAAATRVFDLAISDQADFVLLSGDLFDMEAGGCRAPAFLLSQFERLAEKGINVFWCGGGVDCPDRWPAAIDLPKNVRTFASAVVDEVIIERSGKPVATLLASGHDSRRRTPGDFIIEPNKPYPIGFTHGELDSVTLTTKNIRYWALGGTHKPSISDRSSCIVGFPGTPQSRRAAEFGSHGCHLVRVDASGATRTQFIELDAIRWLPQKLAIAESSTADQIKEVLGERAIKLISDNSERLLLVDWQVSPTGEFNSELRNRRQVDDILQWLRSEFGGSEHGLWSVGFSIDPPASLPAGWFEEDTILGDYLRAIGRYQSDESISLNLHEYLPNTGDVESSADIARPNSDARQEILSRATLIGVDYLAANRDAA